MMNAILEYTDILYLCCWHYAYCFQQPIMFIVFELAGIIGWSPKEASISHIQYESKKGNVLYRSVAVVFAYYDRYNFVGHA